MPVLFNRRDFTVNQRHGELLVLLFHDLHQLKPINGENARIVLNGRGNRRLSSRLFPPDNRGGHEIARAIKPSR